MEDELELLLLDEPVDPFLFVLLPLLELELILVFAVSSWAVALSLNVLRIDFVPSSLVTVSVTNSWFSFGVSVILTVNSLVVSLLEVSLAVTFNTYVPTVLLLIALLSYPASTGDRSVALNKLRPPKS